MDGIKWIKVTNENFDIYGVDENFKRMPPDVSKGISASVATLSRQSAGCTNKFSQKTAKKEEVLWRISAFRSQESSAV